MNVPNDSWMVFGTVPEMLKTLPKKRAGRGSGGTTIYGVLYAAVQSDGVTKVGCTVNPRLRLRQLLGIKPSAPGAKFSAFYASHWHTNYVSVEKAVHRLLAKCRVEREFFTAGPDKVLKVLSQVELLDRVASGNSDFAVQILQYFAGGPDTPAGRLIAEANQPRTATDLPLGRGAVPGRTAAPQVSGPTKKLS